MPPRARDDARSPLLSERDGNGYASDLGRAKTEIFLQKGLDRRSGKTPTDLPVGQFGREPITQSGRRTSALARIPDSRISSALPPRVSTATARRSSL